MDERKDEGRANEGGGKEREPENKAGQRKRGRE